MDYPKVEPHQFIVMHCEIRTGIVTFADGKWHLGIGDHFLIFDSVGAACGYCEKAVMENSEMECWIIGSAHNQLKRVVTNKWAN